MFLLKWYCTIIYLLEITSYTSYHSQIIGFLTFNRKGLICIINH